MALLISKLVRCLRLPPTMKNRPVAKAVLLALADDCRIETLCAFTSRITIAQEVEICPDTVDVHLLAAQDAGFLLKVAAARQHRPATYLFVLPHIIDNVDPVAFAKLPAEDHEELAELLRQHWPHTNPPDSEPVPTLSDSDSEAVPTLATSLATRRALDPVPTLSHSDSEIQNPDSENSPPDSEAVPTERMNGIENKDRTLAPTPRFTNQAKEPNGSNFFVIRKVAIEILTETPGLDDADLIETVKERCAARQIDYGRHDNVPFQVVVRGCDSARGWQKLQATKAKLISGTGARR